MNNLTQEQRGAKEAYLTNQLEQVLKRYKQADNKERAAIIRNIDSFLPVTSNDEKGFWLKLRERLERLNEKATKIQ